MALSHNNPGMDCFKDVINKTSDLVINVNREGHFIHVNKSWKDELGYTDREIKALKVWEVIHPQSKERFHNFFQQAVTSKTAVDIETIFVAKNHSTFPAKGSIKSHSDEKGNVVGLWGIFQNTAVKESDQALRKKAELLQNINDNIFDLVSMADPEGNFTYVSKSHQVLGYDPEWLIGKSALEFVHPDDLQGTAETLQELISNKMNDLKAEFRYRCADGHYIWLETLGRFITDDDGNIVELFFSSRDITERKLVEQSLREEEAFRKLLLELATNFINIPLEQYDTAINEMLARIGSYLDTDRVFVFKHDHLREVTSEIYEWCAEEIESDKEETQEVTFDSFAADILEDMQKGKIIQIPDTSKMTEYPRMKPFFKKQGIRSLLAIPMFHEKINIGLVGFSSINRIRTYTENETSILQVLAEILSNILARQQSEKQMLAQKERMANILQGTNVGTWEWNIQSGETVFNEKWAEMIGYTLEELSPVSIDTWSKYTHPEDLKASNEMLDRHFKGELDYYDCECRMKHKNGHWIWVNDRGRLITRTADGKPLLMFGTHTDITEQKQAKEALIESEKKYRHILETIEEGYYEVDLQGNFVFFNDSLCRISGYSRSELMHKNYENLSWNPQTVYKTFNRVYRTGKPEQAAGWTIVTKDGRKIFVELSISLRRDPYGNPLGFQGVIRDITERKEAEEALADKNKMLSVLNTYSIQQTEARAYNELLDLIAEQIDGYLDIVASSYSEYNPEKKTFTLKKVKASQWLIDLAAQMGFKAFLGTEIPINNEQYSEIISSTIVISSRLEEALLNVIPVRASRAIQKVSGIKYLVGLGHIIEGHLYGISTIGLKNELNTATVDFLKSYAHITAISLRRLQAEEEIRYISLHDSLTSLFNRYFLEEEMARLDTARQLPLSVIMADLNGLKMINDTYGHTHGDEMLKAVAAIIKNCCRKEDIIARWGGDEFVVLLPRTNALKAEEICKRINTRCNDCRVENIPLSVALGTASKTSQEEDLIKILHEAENEMYKQKLAESRSTRSAVLNTLLKTLEEKSYETEMHTQRMKEIARLIGLKMNLPDGELNRLDLLITLHDIGKINISEEILTKEDQLTAEEWEEIKRHPEIGFRITRATEEFSHVAEDILSHHEKWDGSGYPRGLKERDIPILARITALADAYEVMSNGRPYKKALSHQEIVDEFINCSGKQFDPELTALLIQDILKEIVQK